MFQNMCYVLCAMHNARKNSWCVYHTDNWVRVKEYKPRLIAWNLHK